MPLPPLADGTSAPTCEELSRCSGCPDWQQSTKTSDEETPAFLQLQQGAELHWRQPLPRLQRHDLGGFHFRQKLDFTLEAGKIGLYQLGKKSLLDINSCGLAEPALNEFLHQFRTLLPELENIKKGSVRLRLSPQGKRGVWLDFANWDIKTLLGDGRFLHQLLNLADHIEIGQRFKQLTLREGKLKLTDPSWQVWTQTFSQGKALDLWALIGSFTQTGVKANHKMAQVIEQMVRKVQPHSILEFGCGLGTLTLPAYLAQDSAEELKNYWACEFSESALQGLQLTLEALALNQQKNLHLRAGDFQKQLSLELQPDLLLVNPPRSGVGRFFDNISASTNAVIYMSCFTESLLQDCQSLLAKGFQLSELHWLDQFPRTHHAEWITLWTRS